ncbi:MBL fold metallo-hydrolase [Streptomyces sp. NPDC091292]|uniref:MBL fold metallo-hydrolase n=1 Tax=Streptomyces sp. NPDC091292 TaxID=3365991 RepID=UPI0037F90464
MSGDPSVTATDAPGTDSPVTGTRVTEVADGVFAYVQDDGGWWVNTTGFVVGGDQVLAVDACATERRTRALLGAIAGTAAKPVRTLVNTHYHGDHTHGNVLFDQAVIVGHERCRAGVLADPVLEHTPPVFAPMPHWGAVRKAPPTVTFTDRLTLWLDDLEVQLRHVGGPAHTDSDIVVWLPQRDVLFTGDLVFNGGTPLLMSGSVTGYLRTLEHLRAIGATTLVPGHGTPCGQEVIAPLERYARLVLDAAAQGRSAGLSPLETARELDLGEFKDLTDPERIVLNLHRAYLDLDAENGGDRDDGRGRDKGGNEDAFDYPAAFADTVAFNGGRPLRCTA